MRYPIKRTKLATVNGFSLTELLVVLVVVGALLSIAVPNVPYVLGYASDASAQRNAQNLVNVYSAAVAAGAFREEGYPEDLPALVESLAEGVWGENQFAGTEFTLSGIDPNSVDSISRFVDYAPESGVLKLSFSSVSTEN